MNIAQLIALFLLKIDTTGNNLTSGQDLIDSLNALVGQQEFGPNESKLTLTPDGNAEISVDNNINLIASLNVVLRAIAGGIDLQSADGFNVLSDFDDSQINWDSVQKRLRSMNTNIVLNTVTSGDITLNSAEQINLVAATILEATVGGQFNVTTGDSSTINVGGEFILKSTLSKAKLQSDSESVEIQSINSNTKIVVDGINGRVFLNATQGQYIFANTPTYANDAAADADSGLLSGTHYKLTGSRAIYQKP